MADVPQTIAEWAAHGATNPLAKAVLNTLMGRFPLLGVIPMAKWPGGEDYSWVLNKTLPTITWEAETATHESTQALRRKLRAYLAYGHGEIEVPIASSSSMTEAMSMEREDVMDLIRAMGKSMGTQLFTGGYRAEASVTIYGTGLAATPYVDAVTASSANLPSGLVGLKYTHVGTFLQMKAPGSTTYGAQVACAADNTFTLYDGDDTTMSLSLTLDVSDLAANCEMPGAILLQRPEAIAGLKELAVLDSGQVFGASTNGDAPTLAHLDELEEAVYGPKNELYYIMNPRTRRYYKHLIAAAGGTRPEQYMGRDLSKFDLVYEGVPLIADSNVGIAETQGTCSTAGRVYAVRMNMTQGLHMFYGEMSGPNEGTAAAVTDTDIEGGPQNLPVYLRRLGESETKQTFKWRISANIASVLRTSKACAVRYGLTA